jgi:hypothetical protein
MLLANEFRMDPLLQDHPEEFIVHSLEALLLNVPSFGADNSVFWDWLRHKATLQQLMDIFTHVGAVLPASNGFIASFNPIISLCTGAHNNASLLGSLTQSLSALFYLIPYQAKSKFPFMGCLTIIDHALDHIKRHTSKANDSGTTSRTVRHLLTRIINRLHLHIEISDYQIAAALLELPSMIYSDKCIYGNPLSLRALCAHLNLLQDDNALPLRVLAESIQDDAPPPVLPGALFAGVRLVRVNRVKLTRKKPKY